MLKQTIKITMLSLLLIHTLAAEVAVESSERTFADGASLQYVPEKGKRETSTSPIGIEDIVIRLPYFKTIKVSGKANLSKESTPERYKIALTPEIDPTAMLEFSSELPDVTSLRNDNNGNITIQIGDAGESIQGSYVIFNQMGTTIKAESLDYSHTYAKGDEKADLYSNTLKFLVKNGEAILNVDTQDPFALQEIIKNPFSKFKEIALNVSYVSTKDVNDYQKGLNVSCSGKGTQDFTFESALKAEFPFKDVPGAETLEGFIYTLAIPTINLRIEGEIERKQLKDALEHTVNWYEAMLESNSNSFTDKVLASLKNNRDEIIARNYKYITEFPKEDIASFFLTLKGASSNPEDPQGKMTALAALDLAARKFQLKSDFQIDQNRAYKGVISLPEPETSLKELSRGIRTHAYLIEPILKDLGYMEAIQNGSDPEKMLRLLRQLSDNPQATGNTPVTITVKMDENGTRIGTLSMEKAAQLVIGWALMAVPLSIGQ